MQSLILKMQPSGALKTTKWKWKKEREERISKESRFNKLLRREILLLQLMQMKIKTQSYAQRTMIVKMSYTLMKLLRKMMESLFISCMSEHSAIGRSRIIDWLYNHMPKLWKENTRYLTMRKWLSSSISKTWHSKLSRDQGSQDGGSTSITISKD